MRNLLLALLALGLLVRAHAQSQLDPVTVPVDIVAEFTTNVPPAQWEGGWFSVSGASINHSVQYPGTFTYDVRLNLKPGMAYYYNVSTYRIQDWKFRVHPPAGYTVFIENVERQRYNGPGDKLLKVRIAATSGLAAGAAPEPRPGRVLWAVGLGQLKNGDPAGEIQMRESAITADCFKPVSLYYDSDNPDVRVVKLSGILRQVFANECLADIQGLSSASYIIRFFARTQVGQQNPDGTWQVPLGNEFASYLVENPNHPTLDRIKITRTDRINGTRTSWTQLQKSGDTWTLFPWNSGTFPAVPDSQTVVTYSNNAKNETISVRTSNNVTQAQTLNEYQDYGSPSWGRELYRTTVGSGGTNPLQTTLDYYTSATQKGHYRQVRSRIHPDGSWERYEYFDDPDRRGQVKRTFGPFGDTPATPPASPDSSCVVTDIDYAADFTGQRTLPSSIVTSRGGVTMARTLIGYNHTAETRNGLPIVVATRDDYSDASNYLRTITRTYRADAVDFTSVPNAAFYAGKPHSVIRPDGTMQAYAYAWGVFTPSTRSFTPMAGGTEFVVATIEGTTSSTGNHALTSYYGHVINGGSAPGFHLVPNKSTATETVFSPAGLPIYTSKHIYTSSGWQRVSGQLTEYVQNLGAYPSWISADSGTASTTLEVFSADYNDGNLLSWSKDASGIESYFMHDSLGRRYGQLVSRVAGQPIVTPHPNNETWSLVRYDAASRVTHSWTANAFNYPNPASTDIVASTAYDWAGRVTSQTAPAVVGETVTTATTTYTYFHGANPRATRVVRPDGSDIISITYLDGRPKSVTGTGTAPQYFTYWIDGDGKLCTVRSLTATWSGDGWTAERTDWLGRSAWVSGPTFNGNFNATLEYNSAGKLAARRLYNASWQSLLAPTRYRYDTNGDLDRSGMDVNQNGHLDDTGLDRVTLTSADFHHMDGAWWSRSTSRTLTDINNATTGVAATTYTRLTGLYTAQPDGSRLTGETRTVDANGQTSVARTFVDRAARRVTTSTTVPGSTTVATSVIVNGLTASSTSSTGVQTEQTYDGHRRPIRTTTRNAAATGDNVFVELEYYPGTTLVKHRKNLFLGGATFQQTYYDNMGRVSVDRIYDSVRWRTRRFAYTTRGELWRQWGSGQQPVEYEYNTYGWRTKMRAYRGTGLNWDNATWPGAGQSFDETVWTYQGSTGLVTAKRDPKNATVNFTFNDRGQLLTREWARLVPAGHPNAGQRVRTTYTYEETPAYPTGDLREVSYNDGTPSVGYSRNLGGAYTMRHGLPEAIFDGTGGRVLWYRPHDLQVTHEYLDQGFYGNSGGQYRTFVRSYDTLGRLSGYDTRWSGSGSAGFHSVAYAYDAATGRVSRITGTRVGISSRAFDYQYRPDSDQVSAVIGVGFGFRRDTGHQGWRELIDGVSTSWNGAVRASFTHDYDWAGQRVGQRIQGTLAADLGFSGGIQNTYTPNARGEITTAQATRVDNGVAIPNRYRLWDYDSQGNRDYETRSPGAIDYVIGPANQYTSVGGLARTYDADGNLTGDGVWQYYWDGENRLRSMVRNDGTRSLQYTYDYMGRRVGKVVRNGSLNAPIASDRRYIYDGWNIIQELDAQLLENAQQPGSYKTVRTFTWGLDLTGTVHGGGGVGGLLAIHRDSETLLPLYDANGNVHGLIDATSGVMKAAYAYSAFGETLQAVNLNGGTAATDNPIRFASKWLDVESGLYDYNHRIYSPSDGRFLSRDPIAENGGLNLYTYCGNDAVGHWDYLGQSWFSKLWKKFRHVIIANVIRWVGNYFYPGLGNALYKLYNTAIGARYGGTQGAARGWFGSSTAPGGGNYWGITVGERSYGIYVNRSMVGIGRQGTRPDGYGGIAWPELGRSGFGANAPLAYGWNDAANSGTVVAAAGTATRAGKAVWPRPLGSGQTPADVRGPAGGSKTGGVRGSVATAATPIAIAIMNVGAGKRVALEVAVNELSAAVANGQITPDEADAIFEAVNRGVSNEMAHVNAKVQKAQRIVREGIRNAQANRPTRYRHYGYEADAEKFAGGLKSGSYATTAEGAVMSGADAQQVLALPHEAPPDAYYDVIVPQTVPVVGPQPVESTEVPPRTGGGVEYIFPAGTPPGSVVGPFPLPSG